MSFVNVVEHNISIAVLGGISRLVKEIVQMFESENNLKYSKLSAVHINMRRKTISGQRNVLIQPKMTRTFAS